MKQLYIVLSSLLFSSCLQAQVFFEKMICRPDTVAGVVWNSNSLLSSDHFPMKFSSVFLTGGHIHNDLKDDVLNRLSHRNHFGLENRYGVSFMFRQKLLSDSVNAVRIIIGYNEWTTLFSTFGQDAFRLLMYGNEWTIGEKAKLDNTRFRYDRFYKLSVGATATFGRKSQHGLTIMPFFSLHKPPLFLDFKEGYFLTEPDTSQVTAALEGKLLYGSDNGKLFSSSGGGIDIFYANNALLRSHTIVLGIENIGFFEFIGKSYEFSMSNEIYVSGIHLTNFNHLDSIFSDYADSLSALGGNIIDSSANLMMLPVKFSLTFIQSESERLSVHGRCSFYPQYYSIPFFELFPVYHFQNKWSVGLPVFFGGMGGAGFGIYSDVNYRRLKLNLMLTVMAGRGKNVFLTGLGLQTGVSYQFRSL